VSDLAESMVELAAAHRRAAPPDSSKKASLDQERMVELHFTILSWIIAGGHAGSARAWSRAKFQSGESSFRRESPDGAGSYRSL
jgi:hypothetical protein